MISPVSHVLYSVALRSTRLLQRRSRWLFAVFCSLLLASGLTWAQTDTENALKVLARDATVDYLAELSKRRRLTTVFHNPQNPFRGVQIGYTNVTTGNLTFLNRDLVRLDRIPVVFGRSYDSQAKGSVDFGPGWRLTVAESIVRHGSSLVFSDSSQSNYKLEIDGQAVRSPHPHLTGVTEGRITGSTIRLSHLGLQKRFERRGNRFLLTEVRDAYGNWLRIRHERQMVSRVTTSSGRFIQVHRTPSGRISGAVDDIGRRVAFEYDAMDRLSMFHDLGGTTWRYEYDLNDRLTAIIDPRDVQTLHADYIGERVSEIRVQHETHKFRYRDGITYVSDGLSQSATFWSHASGLTESVQDFAGAVTRLSFNEDLSVTEFEFDGRPLVQFEYNADRNPVVLAMTTDDGLERYRLWYREGRLLGASVGATPIAEYRYNDQGDIKYANDGLGERSYQYDDGGRLEGHSFDGNALTFETDEVGLIRRVYRDDTLMATFRTDRADRLRALRVRSKEGRLTNEYRYEKSGFRDDARYYGGAVSVDFDYDSVGNMSKIRFEDANNRVREDRYDVGPENQLHRIIGQTGPDIEFEYDPTGRPVRLQQDGRTADIHYDRVGRMTGVDLEGESLFTIDYAPMDQDAVFEADQRTTWTLVDAPAASSVFDSLESIAYVRPRGSPFGSIRFDEGMARFVIGDLPITPPDALQLASITRRMLPTDGTDINPYPMAFDKPSNSLFVPPEFYSTNCYSCLGSITAADIEVGSSDLTTITSVGTTVRFDVTADGICFWLSTPPNTPPATFIHDFSYGDGTVAPIKYTGEHPDTSFFHAYSSSGAYLASDDIRCDCTISPFGFDSAVHTVVVLAPAEREVEIFLTFDDGPTSAGANNTKTVLDSLRQNAVIDNIPATFFIQTHVPNRLPAPLGKANVEKAIADGHEIGIHTGSTVDHVPHPTRVVEPPYDANGDEVVNSADGQNGLESDMIRAKVAIAALAGGSTPTLVRAPFLNLAHPDILPTYSRQSLTHVGIDIQGDDVSPQDYPTITSQIQTKIPPQLSANNFSIIMLYHDIRPNTANHLKTDGANPGYLQTIVDTVEAAGPYVPVFEKL